MRFNKLLAISAVSFLMMPVAHAASHCLKGTFSVGANPYWTPGQLTIANQCDSTQSLDQQPISFVSQNSDGKPVLGVQTFYGWPNGSSNFTYKTVAQNNVATAILHGSVAAKASVTLSFGVGGLGDSSFDVGTAQNSLTIGGSGPTPANGEIDVTVDPSGAAGNTQADEIKVEGSKESQPHIITVTNWNATTKYALKDLPHDTYVVTIAPLQNGSIGVAKPASVIVDSATPQTVDVSYESHTQNCFSGKLSGFDANLWYTKPELTVTNVCASAQNLNGVQVSFTSRTINNGPVAEQAIWGDWPYTSTAFTHDSNNKATATLKNANNSQLAPGQSVHLHFGIEPNGAVFDSAEAISTLRIGNGGPTPIPVNDGIIDVTVDPSGIANEGEVGEIKITGSKATTEPKTIEVKNWSKLTDYQFIGLPHDTYTVSVLPVKDSKDDYTGYADPASFTLNSPITQLVKVNYRPLPASGSLQLELGAAPMKNAAGPVAVKVEDDTTQQDWTKQLNWNSDTVFQDLPAGAGNHYTVTMSDVTNGLQTASAATVWHPLVVKNTVTPVQLSFLPPVNNPTQTVTFNLSGLPSDTTASLDIKDIYTNDFAKASLSNGETTEQLPIDDTFTVNAVAKSLPVSIHPQNFTLSASTQPPVVTVQFSNTPPAANKFVVYWGGWNGGTYNLENLTKTVNVLNLAFANINSNNQVDTSVSGYISNVPAQGSQMWPSYVSWTAYKYHHPDTKVLLSIGGATFSSIWATQLTPATVATMAQNIVTVVDTQYPAYSGNFAYPADLLGNVEMNGVDLDVEAGGRVSPVIATNVIALIKAMKQDFIAQGHPDKLITLAGFSVGADPDDSSCTSPGSIHCGEDVPILQGAGNDLNWVNVMAYDAGMDYATSKYQLAMANYASYVGKAKTILGLDLQSQWQVPIPETPAQLMAKAQWALANGYAGAMLWGVNIINNPATEQSYVDAISQAFHSLF